MFSMVHLLHSLPSASPGWEGLVWELLGLIAERLDFQDRLRMLLVCKRWHDQLTLGGGVCRSLEAPAAGGPLVVTSGALKSLHNWLAKHGGGVEAARLKLDRHVIQACPPADMVVAMLLGCFNPTKLRVLSLRAGGPPISLENATCCPVLASLTALTELQLRKMGTRIPCCVAQLTNLQRLTFEPIGPDPLHHEGTRSLQALFSLTHLCLRSAVTLPPSLDSLTALRTLHIRGATYDDVDQAQRSMERACKALTGLEELVLVDGAVWPELLPALWSLRRLTSLTVRSMDGEWEDAPAPHSLWSGLAELTRLSELDVAWNGLESAPAAIAQLGLTHLSLAGNPLGEEGHPADVALPAGPYLACLQWLDLRHTAIESVPAALRLATSLTRLDLYCCHELTLTRDHVAQTLGAATALRRLMLCGEMMQTQRTANALLCLGRALPDVEVDNSGCCGSDDDQCGDSETEDDDDDEYEDDDDGAEYEDDDDEVDEYAAVDEYVYGWSGSEFSGEDDQYDGEGESPEESEDNEGSFYSNESSDDGSSSGGRGTNSTSRRVGDDAGPPALVPCSEGDDVPAPEGSPRNYERGWSTDDGQDSSEAPSEGSEKEYGEFWVTDNCSSETSLSGA